jgi:ribosomal protein S18 acetylase RimI-like enzyme
MQPIAKRYTIEEVTYAEILSLARETAETGAFVLRRDDVGAPFVLAMGEIFADHPDFRVFGLREAETGQVVGYGTLLPESAPHALELGPLYIAPDHRGRGWGRRLIKALIAAARAHGARYLHTATWGENARMRHLFDALGFEFVNEEPNARVNGDSTVHYRLDL